MVAVLFLVACSDPAVFRPRGGASYPSTPDAYRVQDVGPECTHIGMVVDAKAISDIAETAANNGGTHYVISNDMQSEETVTNIGMAQTAPGMVMGKARSRREKHHDYVAKVYRCK